MSNATEYGALAGRADLVGSQPPRRRSAQWPARVGAAVAVALAVTGGAWVGARAFGGHPGTTAQGGQPGPVSDGGPATSGSPTPSGAARSAGSSGSSGRPAGGTTLDVGPLRLTLPAGWAQAQRETKGGRTMACLRKDGSDGYCDLWVTVVDDPTVSGMSVDTYGGMMALEPGLCTSADDKFTLQTTAYKVRTLGDRPVEYRAYDQTCRGAVQHPEQWTVPTWPAVQISFGDVRPGRTGDVHAIVAGAQFTVADSGHRVTDVGQLTAHSGTATVTLDREVFSEGGLDNGQYVNDNPATYTYRLAPAVAVTDDGELCADVYRPNGRSCPLATVLGRIDQHRTDVPVQLVFDRDGTVVGMHGIFRS